jgi:methionyl-tRNA synthetase
MVPDLMQALYRAKCCSILARREDIPREDEGLYRQIAEVAIQLVCDPTLRDAAEYYAAHQVAQSRDMEFFALDLRTRWRIVQDAQVVVRRFLAFCRGEYPAALPTYREQFVKDRDAVTASAQRTAETAKRRFDVIPGGQI